MCVSAGLGTFDIAAFKVELSNPLGGAILGTRTECRVIITPNARAHSAAPDRVSADTSRCVHVCVRQQPALCFAVS